MALGEVQVNQELMAIIATIIGGTIPLGAVMFALIRWLDGRSRKDMAALRDEMKAGDGRLEGAIGELRDEMRAGDDRLRDELQASERRLEGAIGELRDGIKEITERLVNVGDRLSKVEGVMEGMFWSARNQPSETPREGAA